MTIATYQPIPQLWVEPVGDLILGRIRGVPTQQLLRQCQEQILQLVEDLGHGRVLLDALEMEPPSVDVVLSQRALDERLERVPFRRAIVVPNAKLAYLARLAFGEGDYRVFYNDMTGAIMWLHEADVNALGP
ncbi:hypothetical protein [Noviherbaspirillum sp. Root189]|uniref:hypothetical protein n=1 Tax=Noviherbaspirillum sp. Root189 TaxID=1736487 RepID=UPI00071368F6|nr:hypothetical protein [Noviherbaspirillum sp. Root189]KRB92883.1 hypothetical protein ASE07_14750 [Noviherbaspirillum sp. Root189]